MDLWMDDSFKADNSPKVSEIICLFLIYYAVLFII